MLIKWIGAACVLGACGTFGFSVAAAHRREEDALRQLIAALDYMQCELQYRMTPLPELCNEAGRLHPNLIGQVLLMLAQELNCQISPDAEQCMLLTLQAEEDMPRRAKEAFTLLGTSLGRFDVDGQVKGLEAVREFCRQELAALTQNRDTRLRSYQTLGLCAGAALVILFI